MIPIPEGAFRLVNARVPDALAAVPGQARDPARDGLSVATVAVREGHVAADDPALPAVDLGGAILLPGLVDCHTHLDKGHIWARCPNPDGSFMGALEAVRGDRGANWTGADVRARMEFALRTAYAHGTVAIRTHLDSGDARAVSSWEAFAEARSAWQGRIALQAVSLETIEAAGTPEHAETADLVARHGGILGAVTYRVADIAARLDTFLEHAGSRGLDADFHADETLDPASATLREIAAAKIRTGFAGRVLAGHCCALAAQPEAEALRTLDLVAEAGIDMVSLPLCNMYLQDRAPGRTPRLRGVTLVHEARARGIRTAFASDNTRDPFYAYGDLDMLEVWREATRIAHLDHPVGDWPAAFAKTPAEVMGLDAGVIRPGAPADLIVLPGARSWTELHARPQTDRIVLRAGRPIDTTPPAYDALDSLMDPA